MPIPKPAMKWVMIAGVLLAIILALSWTALAQSRVSRPWSVVSSAGGDTSSTNFGLKATVGETVVGPASSANFGLDADFLLGQFPR